MVDELLNKNSDLTKQVEELQKQQQPPRGNKRKISDAAALSTTAAAAAVAAASAAAAALATLRSTEENPTQELVFEAITKQSNIQSMFGSRNMILASAI